MDERSKLVNELQPLNIPDIVVTLPVLKFSPNVIFVNFSQLANISDISVTLVVLKLLRSRLVSFLHPANIPVIVVTFDVLNVLDSVNVSRFSHPANI